MGFISLEHLGHVGSSTSSSLSRSVCSLCVPSSPGSPIWHSDVKIGPYSSRHVLFPHSGFPLVPLRSREQLCNLFCAVICCARHGPSCIRIISKILADVCVYRKLVSSPPSLLTEVIESLFPPRFPLRHFISRFCRLSITPSPSFGPWLGKHSRFLDAHGLVAEVRPADLPPYSLFSAHAFLVPSSLPALFCSTSLTRGTFFVPLGAVARLHPLSIIEFNHILFHPLSFCRSPPPILQHSLGEGGTGESTIPLAFLSRTM